MKQFISFVRKEFYHIFRDARTTMILLLMPVILIILFGYAITTEIKRVPIAIFDQSRDELTLKMADRLNASEYFELYTTVDSYEDAGALFRQGKVHVIVVFPPQYASTADAQVQVLADATDPNEATQLIAYCSAIIAEQLKGESAVESKAVTPVTTLLYNPQMKGAYNFVPGIMGLIMMLICAMMTSISIVREKETGTMEVLLVSPVRPIYIVVSKMVPYFVLSCINLATILLLSVFVLGVPVAGSLAALWLVSLIYIIANLSLGLLISTMAQQQVIALMFSGLLLMMPTMLLSGMVFPIESMPWPLRGISCILPARWYITAVRKLMIQGLPMIYAWKEIVILASMAVVLIGASLKKLNNRLE